MINPDKSQEHPRNWKIQLKTAGKPAASLADPAVLTEIDQYLGTDQEGTSRFPYRVPQAFVDRMMQQSDWRRILRQFIPSTEELLDHTNFVTDPVGDQHALVGQGVLHKYTGRVLLVTTG
ncbi:MAG: hypothetical protein KDA77_20145, partial [Planctomycetaceae bacterium]|nr:hypothetical protein [Planctomycetaceae bacterium]